MNIKKITLLSLIIGSLLFISLILLKRINYFKVNQVMINNQLISNKHKKAILLSDYNKNLYNINLNKVKSRMQSIYPTQSIQITKKYPDILEINILEKKLIAYLKLKSSKKILLGLNASGIVINIFKNSDTLNKKQPLIMKDNSFNKILIKNKIENKTILSITKSLSLIKKLDKEFYNKIKLVMLSKKAKSNYLIINDLKTRFYFGKELSLVDLMKIDSLEEDLSTKVTYRKIDLRFDDIIASN